MHKRLGFKDCFKCHGLGKKKGPEELNLQQKTDPSAPAVTKAEPFVPFLIFWFFALCEMRSAA